MAFECDVCHEGFESSDSLRRHRWNKHSRPTVAVDGQKYVLEIEDDKYLYPFEGCERSYRRRDGLSRHLREFHTPSPGSAPPTRGRQEDRSCEKVTIAQAGSNGVASGGGRAAFSPEEQDPKETTTAHFCSTSAASTGVDSVNRSRVISYRASDRDYAPEREPSISAAHQASDLEGGGVLEALGLWIHKALRILICRECQVGLTTGVVCGHLKEKHDYPLKAEQKVQLNAVAAARAVYAKEWEVPLPRPGLPPVQGIAPPVDGFSCTAQATCNYSVRDYQTMLKHCREKHGQGLASNSRLRQSTVQAIFPGVGRAYFEVDATASPTSDLDMRRYLRATLLPGVSVDSDPVISQDSDHDRPPLLKITLWDQFHQEIREDVGQRRAVRSIKAKHSEMEHGGIFISLEKAINSHHSIAKTHLESSMHSFTLAKVLLNGPGFSPDQSKHFRLVPTENYSYPGLYLTMIRAMVRKELGHELKLSFSFSTVQMDCLAALIKLLQKDARVKTKGSQEDAVAAYQSFCWSLVYNEGGRSKKRWENPIQRFIWLMALQENGTFMQATSLTPLLAKLKYFCRLATLYESLAYYDMANPMGDPIERLGRMYDVSLRLGTATTFNMLCELQQFASTLAYTQLQDPKVFVDPEYKWLSIGTETLYLDRLRDGIQVLIERVKSFYISLSGDDAWPTAPDGPIVDDLSNTSRGYSFLNEAPFKARSDSFLLGVVERYRLGSLNGGEWSWDRNAVRRLLERADALWGHVIHLLYVGLQLSTRAVQFLQHQLRNSDRPRNLVFQGSEGLFIGRYSKTTNLKGRDACVPAFLAAPLRDILLVLLGGGLREAQAVLSGVEHGDESRWLYRTYLCVRNGSRITPDYFYADLIKRNREIFGCAWGASDFRQGMITLGREFISPNETFPCADEVLAEAADHSSEVDVSHYAVVHGALPRLSNNALSQHRWLSEEWSSLLGMGPSPPPEPVRAVRTKSRSARTSVPDTLAAQVSELVANAVASRLVEIGLTSSLLEKLVATLEMRSDGYPAVAASQSRRNRDPVATAQLPGGDGHKQPTVRERENEAIGLISTSCRSHAPAGLAHDAIRPLAGYVPVATHSRNANGVFSSSPGSPFDWPTSPGSTLLRGTTGEVAASHAHPFDIPPLASENVSQNVSPSSQPRPATNGVIRSLARPAAAHPRSVDDLFSSSPGNPFDSPTSLGPAIRRGATIEHTASRPHPFDMLPCATENTLKQTEFQAGFPGRRRKITSQFAQGLDDNPRPSQRLRHQEQEATLLRANPARATPMQTLSGYSGDFLPFTDPAVKSAEAIKAVNQPRVITRTHTLPSVSNAMPRSSVPLSSSMPNVVDYSARASRVQAAALSRLERTKLLDRYMPALQGMCPYHFVDTGTLVEDHYQTCSSMRSFPRQRGYDRFKRAFSFEKFAYCFSCGMPQDKDWNGEGPRCHLGHRFQKGGGCIFDQFIFRTTFCIWQIAELREKMFADLGVTRWITTDSEFIEWATAEEAEEGKYHNCLEAFLWFCQKKEVEDPSFFQ